MLLHGKFRFIDESNINYDKNIGKYILKRFCENNSNYFIKNININLYPKKIFIKTKETKSWYINLIKSFYSTPRSEWKIDHNFKMPQVLKPYLRYCEVSYENYSIAKNYNGIIQLLFSGRSENITEKQRKYLEKYNFKY